MARIDGLRSWRGFMQAWDLYPLLKERGLMACESRLVDEGGTCLVNDVPITVRSKQFAQALARSNRQPFVHRVLAECDCGRQVPFGKLGQHRKVCVADLTKEG